MRLYKPVRPFTGVLLVLFFLAMFTLKPEPVIEKIDHGFTNEQVEQVYQNLYVQSGLGSKPKLNIIKNDMVNAWTDGMEVTITTGILATMHSVDEIAMVLGHELAHVINYDVLHGEMEQAADVPMNQSYKEAAADKVGAFIMMRAGYNVCKGKRIMQTFRDLFGSDAGAEGHPDSAFRIDELNLPQCNKGFFSNWF